MRDKYLTGCVDNRKTYQREWYRDGVLVGWLRADLIRAHAIHYNINYEPWGTYETASVQLPVDQSLPGGG